MLEQNMIKSKAWLELRGAAQSVYLIFRTKCRMERTTGKPGKRGMVIANNGELVFTYAEAQKIYGISKSRFRRSIDELITKGFVDIAATGMGVHKVTTFYALSERWRFYGTEHFQHVNRPEPSIANPGFKTGNDHWKQSKKNTSAKNAHGTVCENEHGGILTMHTNEHGEKVSNLYKRSNGQWLASKVA